MVRHVIYYLVNVGYASGVFPVMADKQDEVIHLPYASHVFSQVWVFSEEAPFVVGTGGVAVEGGEQAPDRAAFVLFECLSCYSGVRVVKIEFDYII